MDQLISGFHHLTACVGGAQEDINFFTQVVGQRMVKQTVLFDGTNPVYHLYYADEIRDAGDSQHHLSLSNTCLVV